MLFNSLPFAIFFAVVFLVYWSTPWHKARLGLLLIASWFFYAWWGPPYLIMFLVITAMNYIAGRLVSAHRESRPGLARTWMILSIVANLGTLAYFKYTNFTLESVVTIWNSISGEEWTPPRYSIFLPLGISFYTFQMLAYVIDVKLGKCQAIRNPLKMSLFIAFFPQLIAGPIVRTTQFIPQLASKRTFEGRVALHGLDLIVLGLMKKILIADQVAPFIDEVFADPGGLSSGTLILASYAYAVQIYCDFSGYTDIGRGCAKCLGYQLPVNFARPYLAGNIIVFWRQWHITLSSWLKDYLYVPLGGNRKGPNRTYVNLLVTMALGGLWHGAMWTFVIWGVIHGAALAVTRFTHERLRIKPENPIFDNILWKVMAVLGTFHLVTFAWIFFRATSFETAFTIIRGIFAFDFGESPMSFDLSRLTTIDPMIAMGALFALPIAHIGAAYLRLRFAHQTGLWLMLRPIFIGLVIVGILLLNKSGAQQFIYFQF